MSSSLRILHLEDNATDGELVSALLTEEGIDCEIHRVDTRAAFEVALNQERFDLIISDFTLPSFDGLSALALARERCPDAAFIFVSGTIGEEVAVDSLKEGAVDYILKDRISRLPAAVRRAMRESAERAARRIAEQRLREQAALLDKATDAILVHDLDQRITYWNKAAERIYGWTADDVLGKHAAEFLNSPGEAVRHESARIVMQRGEWSGELRQFTREGRELYLASRRTLLRDVDGRPIAVLEINTDVTEKKQFETQFLRSQRMESLGALAGGIAHDLNNVLSPIVMAADLLESGQLDEFGRKMVATIQASVARGTGLVRQILSFARGASGTPVVLQLEHLLKELTRLMQETFPRSVRVQLRLSEHLPPVLGDPTQLHQVLLNLGVNARDAMPNGGQLTIEACPVLLSNRITTWHRQPVSGSFVQITVTDDGTGIPPEIMGRIFEPFFTTKEPDYGTGLGLSTVAGIVKNHGGFVEVSSVLGKGTSFRIYFPTTTGVVATPPAAPEVNLPTGKGEQILLVDDELAVREMIKETLETYRYRVLTASDGSEALSLYLQNPSAIELVITDLMMPSMDGPDFIRALINRDPHIPVICISGLLSDKQPPFEESSALEILQKPFTTERLLSAIRQALAQKNPSDPRTVSP
jgi:PAS domain S-box-containing protein